MYKQEHSGSGVRRIWSRFRVTIQSPDDSKNRDFRVLRYIFDKNFHEDPIGRFYAMLLTDRQTNTG